jgi:hypothetical protein
MKGDTMGLPLDQEKLIASLEELEKRLRQSHAVDDAPAAPEPPRLVDVAPPPYAYRQAPPAPEREPPQDFSPRRDSRDSFDEGEDRRRLILALSALVMVLFVGALGATLAYWPAPSVAPVAEAPESEPAPVAAAPADAVPQGEDAAPPALAEAPPSEPAPAAPPEAAPARAAAAPAPAARASLERPAAIEKEAPAAAAPSAQPAPEQVETVTILPDGSLAPKGSTRTQDSASFTPPAYPTQQQPQGLSQTESGAPKQMTPEQQKAQAAKIAKKKAAAKAKAAAAAKAQAAAAATAEQPPAPAPAPAQQAQPADGNILQGAQRALGSVGGAVKKLIGGE